MDMRKIIGIFYQALLSMLAVVAMAAGGIIVFLPTHEYASDLVVRICGGGFAHIPTMPTRKNPDSPIGPCHGGVADLRKRLNLGNNVI